MNTEESYVSPQIRVIEVHNEGILCCSQNESDVDDPRSGEGSFIRGNRFGYYRY